MDVRVDEPRRHRGAARVDHRVGVLVEPAAHGRDAPLADDERVGIEQRPADVAADERADVADERGHRGAPPSRERVKAEGKTPPPSTIHGGPRKGPPTPPTPGPPPPSRGAPPL